MNQQLNTTVINGYTGNGYTSGITSGANTSTSGSSFTNTVNTTAQTVGTVSEIINFVSSIFGGRSTKDIQNDSFIDGLVSYSQTLGIRGFTHEDVVHLMPGGWGNNYSLAAQYFQVYLKNVLSYPNQDAVTIPGAFAWGGGYYPTHSIEYFPPAINNLPPTGTGGTGYGTTGTGTTGTGTTGTGTSSNVLGTQQPNLAGINTGQIILLAGAAIGAVYFAVKA